MPQWLDDSISSLASLLRNHWQHHAGSAHAAMKDALDGEASGLLRSNITACVQITIEAREVTASYLQTDAISRCKNVTRRAQLDAVLIHTSRFKQLGA